MITLHFPNIETLIATLLMIAILSVLFWVALAWIARKIDRRRQRRHRSEHARWYQEQQDRFRAQTQVYTHDQKLRGDLR